MKMVRKFILFGAILGSLVFLFGPRVKHKIAGNYHDTPLTGSSAMLFLRNKGREYAKTSENRYSGPAVSRDVARDRARVHFS